MKKLLVILLAFSFVTPVAFADGIKKVTVRHYDPTEKRIIEGKSSDIIGDTGMGTKTDASNSNNQESGETREEGNANS